MKTKLNLILMALAVLALSSCGQESSNISGSSSSVGTVSITTDGTTVVGTSSNNYTTIEQVRTAFNSMSLESGVTAGTYIYHIGEDYSSSSSTVSTTVNVSGCFFGLFGDCDNTNTYDSTSLLESYLNNGRMLQIGALDSDASTVAINEATGVSNNDFTYDSYTYSRGSSEYQEMLGLDNTYLESKVSSASVTLSDGTVVDAVVVEFIQGAYTTISSIKRYVLSTNLPVAANPIAVIDGNYNIVMSSLLKTVGTSIEVKSIIVDNFTTLVPSYSNSLEQVNQTNLVITLN